MVLKDIYCTVCDYQTETMMNMNDQEITMFCDCCANETKHKSMPTGGKNVMPSLAAYGGNDWTGHVKIESVNAKLGEDESRKPVTVAGDKIEEKVSAKRELRQDKIKFKRGKRKLYSFQ
ncbi:protease [Rhodobacteraceae phage LS06-2018-MD06]|jgi:hypothetical protein|nr:protease [Rhodobacteraceae phage LS06-2018-MD06]